jgi:flavodoxin
MLQALAAIVAAPVMLGTIPGFGSAMEANVQNQSRTGKILVAYFSWSGNTRGIARQIHQKVGGDLFEIECVTPYSSDYNKCLEEAQRDQRQQARPELKTRVADMAQYDVIFLGYPIWWASIPMPAASFLDGYNFSGKTILPFCSHGGGRFGQSLSAIAKLAPHSKIAEGLSVSYSGGSSLSKDISAWLGKNGIPEK